MNEADNRMLQGIQASSQNVGESFEKIKLRDAIMKIIELARAGNHYLSLKEPWHKIKTDPPSASTTLFICIQLVFALAVLLAPFMPSKSEMIFKQMNVLSKDKLSWESASVSPVKPGHRIAMTAPLFSKIEAKELKTKLANI